jgi:3-hydroxyacyl-CoA dehydrogenase
VVVVKRCKVISLLTFILDSPVPFLKALVADGKLGFKSHQGFKTWDDQQIATLRAAIITHLSKAFPNGK